MKNKLPLSVIILVSQKRLQADLRKKSLMEKTIESVGFAGEVVIYDTGSKSVEDFSQLRNQALKRAQYEWVLFLDSDEILASGSEVEIEKIVKQNKYDLVRVRRKDIFVGKVMHGGEAGNKSLVRLGKKSKMKFVRPVHEVVKVKDETLVGESGVMLYHYAHESMGSFLAKISSYASQEAKHRFEQGQRFDTQVLMEMIFFPMLKFVANFVGRLGFVDGYRGLVYGLMMSLHSILVRVYLYEFTHIKDESF